MQNPVDTRIPIESTKGDVIQDVQRHQSRHNPIRVVSTVPETEDALGQYRRFVVPSTCTVMVLLGMGLVFAEHGLCERITISTYLSVFLLKLKTLDVIRHTHLRTQVYRT
jgi:hypothetical protein